MRGKQPRSQRQGDMKISIQKWEVHICHVLTKAWEQKLHVLNIAWYMLSNWCEKAGDTPECICICKQSIWRMYVFVFMFVYVYMCLIYLLFVCMYITLFQTHFSPDAIKRVWLTASWCRTVIRAFLMWNKCEETDRQEPHGNRLWQCRSVSMTTRLC